jgi:autophagy-related protein 18
LNRFIQISSLAFSEDTLYLITSSSTETVHVFRLNEPTPLHDSVTEDSSPSSAQQGWFSYLGKALSTPASYLPTQVTEPFSQSRAFAQIRLPQCGVRSVCSIACIDGINKILVATSEGILYMSSIDPKEGGEYRYKAFNLLDDSLTLNPNSISSGLTGTPTGATPIGSLEGHMTVPLDDESPPNTYSVQHHTT